MEQKNWEDLITAYGLKNAIEHNGKAISGAVLSSLFHEGLEREKVKEIILLIDRILKEINSMSIEKQKQVYEKWKKLADERNAREQGELPELEHARKRKVTTRFAPYPSGPLHIGNARVAALNNEYASMYKGKMILIIDDTIGSSEKQIIKEAYKLIPEGLDWLKIKYKKPIIYKSDRLKIYYKYAEKLIKLGKAYVCTCSQKQFMELKLKQKECSCRQFSAKEQLERWKSMFSKQIKQGEAVLRIKTSMQDPNPAFRDRVLFRISDRKHVRIGNKYRVWPMLEFSWSIDDKLLGITHIIRGKELMIESDMERFIWDIFKWKHPEIIHTGLLKINLGNTKISKSKNQKEVLSGKYIGWHDPRTWSLQSLEKRGIQPEALKQFLIDFGIKSTETNADVEILYSKNREIIHDKAKRLEFTEGKGNASIIMADGRVLKGKVRGKMENGKIYYLTGLGYCRLDKKGKINEFYFSHP